MWRLKRNFGRLIWLLYIFFSLMTCGLLSFSHIFGIFALGLAPSGQVSLSSTACFSHQKKTLAPEHLLLSCETCCELHRVAFVILDFAIVTPHDSWLPSFTIFPNVQHLKLLSSPLCKPLPVRTVHRTLIAPWNRVTGMNDIWWTGRGNHLQTLKKRGSWSGGSPLAWYIFLVYDICTLLNVQ